MRGNRKLLSIQYNVLNLPSKIEFEDGTVILNIYAADGRKLSSYYATQVTLNINPIENTFLKPKDLISGPIGSPQAITVYDYDIIEAEGTHYIDNFEYLFDIQDESENITDTRIHNAEGYVENGNWYYFRKDHIGNNREVWNATTGATVQKTDYYPSGLPLNTGGTLGADLQPYKHTGKEFIEMGGYDVYDLGFRTYYPAIGRFTTIDPLAESTYSQSPYVYAANNPVRYIDFLGLAATNPTGLEHENDEVSIYDYNGFGDGSGNFLNGCGYPPYGGYRTWDVLFGRKGGIMFPSVLNYTELNSKGEVTYHSPYNRWGALDDGVYIVVDGERVKVGTELPDVDYEHQIGKTTLYWGLNGGYVFSGTADWAKRILNILNVTIEVSGAENSRKVFRLFDGKENFDFKVFKDGRGNPGNVTKYKVKVLGKTIGDIAGVLGFILDVASLINGDTSLKTQVDAGVGLIWILDKAIEQYTGAAIPGVGEIVAIYGLFSLSYELGKCCGPFAIYNKYFNNDEK